MKQTLLNKYMKSESSTSEERKLLDLLLETPQDQLSQDERAVLELLSYAEQEEDDEDVFAVDYTEEYNKAVKPARIIRMWPWVAAACVAGVLTMFLMPPRTVNETAGDAHAIAKVEPKVSITTTEKQQVKETPMEEPASKSAISQKQSKATSAAITKVSETVKESEPEEEPVQMSEETRMELLMAYLSCEEQMQRDIDIEEEIRKIRQRGECLLSMCKND